MGLEEENHRCKLHRFRPCLVYCCYSCKWREAVNLIKRVFPDA